ncbi:MAG: putative HTH-type transcriptional regulator [Candidatus Thorarchaeota archaeon AB_25]|nr:MAG: putative HTH-type transcriptional regulator [Candidatus Thorarchaeota archaeon AB_25]
MQSILSDAETHLLEVMIQNSRNTPSTLGLPLGKSRNWVSRTIQSLVKKGVIRSYTTIIDPAQVKAARDTILFMKSNPREQDVSKKVLQMEELESLDGIAGEFSLIGFFRFDSQGAFEDLLDRVDSVVATSGTGKYNLVQVLTTYKKNRFKITHSESTESYLSSKELEILRIIRRQKPTPENPFPLSQDAIGKLIIPPMRQPAVSKAIDKLLIKKAIVGYSIDIDFSYIGLPVKFFVRMKVSPGTASQTAQRLADMDEVWDLYRTSEDYTLFATVRTANIESFNRFLRKLYENENVLDTHSHISLEEWFVPVH